MNSKFTEEQIKEYAAQFRLGDAIWCGGEWKKVIKESDSFTPTEALLGERCSYTIKRFKREGEKPIVAGFLDEYNFGIEKQYRVTTLDNYKLQGGEKIVWLGQTGENLTFGKVYKTFDRYEGSVLVVDDERYAYQPRSLEWGVIPLYEHVKNLGKTTITEQVNEVIKNKMNTERPASSHYHIDNNGNDVWQFADDNLSKERVKGFHQVNALKYIARYEKKHDTAEKRIEDLEKAKVSIDKLIELERKSMTSKGCDVVEE